MALQEKFEEYAKTDNDMKWRLERSKISGKYLDRETSNALKDFTAGAKYAQDRQSEMLKVAKEALGFYSDKGILQADIFNGDGEAVSCPISRDACEKAKQALATIEEMENL